MVGVALITACAQFMCSFLRVGKTGCWVALPQTYISGHKSIRRRWVQVSRVGQNCEYKVYKPRLY
jgi:hypothetical protein